MSVCLLYVREFSLFWREKKTGDPTPVLQNQAKSVSQSIPSLNQRSPCKGDFLTYLSKLYIDNGITYVQLNILGERFSRTLRTFAESTSLQLSTSEPSPPWSLLPNYWPNKPQTTQNILPRPQATRPYPISVNPIEIMHERAPAMLSNEIGRQSKITRGFFRQFVNI